MSDFRQDRKSAKPLLIKIFLLWHGPCMGLCERISETSSMIMRTENAVAAVKTALSPAIKPPKGRRSWPRRAIAPASNTLMGLESVSRDGDAGIQTGRKGHTSLPQVAGLTRGLPPSWNARVYIRRPERAGQILASPVGTGARSPRGGLMAMADIRREQAA
ncbi:hypothetical protein NKH09_21690 [Mesorhizobium sp. M1339]|uniref:hypothetical protein n=1 Tax=Mesorhizobium sp. M1339 TaxID=2957086 RepID=UPI0033373E9D